MKVWSAALSCLILISIVHAIEMNEQINVYGDGSFYARTNAGEGQDTASGIGQQDYSRFLAIGDDSSFLESNYNYKNVTPSGSSLVKSKNYTNYYYVSGKSAAESQHFLSIRSNESIESSAVIERNGDSFSTTYDIKSRNGSLTEMLSEKEGARNNYLAESRVNGDFNLSSAVNENVQVWRGYDIQDLQLKLDSVITMGDPGRDAEGEIALETGYLKTPEEEVSYMIEQASKKYNAEDNTTWDVALGYLDKALEIDHKSANAANAWRSKGNIRFYQERYSDAITSYDNAIKLNPEYKEVYINKVNALIHLNKTSNALDTINTTLAKFPDDADAWYLRGYISKEQGKYDDALKFFNEALRLNPGHSLAELNRGKIFYQRSNLIDAKTAFENVGKLASSTSANRAEASGYLTNITLQQQKIPANAP